MMKRYQYWTSGGIKWTPWFRWDCDSCPKYQLGKKLLNEYKEA